MKALRRTQFGNPILRQVARRLEPTEIRSERIQALIADLHFTLTSKKYGVGLAAPQVGHSLALSVINIQPTDYRPEVTPLKLTVINPEIIQTYGRRTQLWEGCLSFGASRDTPFAKVPRYVKIRVAYLDGQGKPHEADFEGLPAHILQHEIDHLQGKLFVDRVVDTTTYVTMSEYRRLRHSQT